MDNPIAEEKYKKHSRVKTNLKKSTKKSMEKVASHKNLSKIPNKLPLNRLSVINNP